MVTFLKNLFVLIAGVLAGLYLLNPGAGVFEFLPDNIPLVGNVDEATATLLLVSCLAYFGIDIRRLLPATRVRQVANQSSSKAS